MEQKLQEKKKTRSFSFYLLFSMIILVVCIVGFLTINDYLYTKNSFDRESHLLQIQTEQNIRGSLVYKDATSNLFDNILNERMNKGLLSLVQEYERSGRIPALMNISRIREELGSDYDVYIIDEYGIIIRTTYGPELGMDFRTIPYFYDYLTKIRNQDGFFPDRIVREFKGAGKFRKYAYMPTPDHKYVLELGLSGENLIPIIPAADEQGTITQIVTVNPYIERFRVFNSVGRKTDDNTIPEEPALTYISEAIRTRSNVEIPDPDHARVIRYIFVDMKKDQYGSDTSRIVEITYSTRMIDDALTRLLLFHLLVAVFTILFGCLLALFISRRVTRPIQKIVSDADSIAHGNLDHHIRDMENSEFAVLGTSINTMVDSLHSASRKMKDDAIFQKEMITRLPVGIFLKTAEDGKYVFWNDACGKLFHLTASSVLGKTDRQLFPADIVVIIEKEDRQLFLNRSEIRNKIISNKYLGDRIIHMIIVPIFDSVGTPQYILGISKDVSSENINLKMDLLFSITRQDILDNLSVIMSHLERAQLKNTHDDMQKFFDKTIGSIESIRNQLSYMRALQELGLVSPKWQSVRQAFYDAVKLLPDTSVDIRADVGNLEIFADPLLPRVFYTLLENSLRNGSRTISDIRLSARCENQVLHIVYEDNGPGIPALEKEKIFDTGYDNGTFQGFFLVKELLSFTRILIRENGTDGSGVRFEIEVPKDKFRFMP
jgi:signal transduction histidine kinase/HAMP domain-containing protein